MIMAVRTLAIALLLTVVVVRCGGDGGGGLTVPDADRRSPLVRRFAQTPSTDIDGGGGGGGQRARRRRESGGPSAGTSVSESVECIKIEGVFEERTKEEKFIESFKHEVHLNGDSKSNLQLAWTGNDYERIIVVTSDFGTSTIYLSDSSGKNFVNISHTIEKAGEHDELTLQKHTNDSKAVYLVGNSILVSSSVLYVSLDGASTFQRVQLEFSLTSSLLFHATQPELVLAVSVSFPKSLYFSRDKGLTWKKIKSNVMFGKWGTGSSVDEIFVITNNYTNFFETDNTANCLEKSVDLGASWSSLLHKVYTFGVGDKFLYASIYKESSPFSERYLKVSTDGGLSWNDVRLPTITQERFYSILDSNEGQLFLHVDEPGDTGRGILYTSDATGIIFSESLKNHLYPNYEDLTDFYRVQSMRGVYIASQLMPDDSIRTMMTFDRGGEWQPIKRPEGAPCKDESKECYLQIHNLYSIRRGIRADPPLSVPNAVGIILVHGHVADALQTTDPDVFVSSDGGYSWRLALKGPHHYQIADHGGLLVAVPANTETPSLVKFSTDEGRCWISYNYTEKEIIFTGLLIEPGNRDMTVAIWGYTQTDRIWHTHILNFSKIIDRKCEAGDYETWVPHQHNNVNGCLLGQKESFLRIKANSWCYNGKAYQVDKTTELCQCTADDYDCDYGFKRESEVCVKDTSVSLKEIDICFRGHEERFVPMGYHKIPGDKCSGGFLPYEARLVDLSQVCSGDSAIGASSSDIVPKSQHGRTAAKVFTGMFAIFSVILIVILVTYLAKKYQFIKKRPSYRYSSIRCEDDEPAAVVTKHKGTSLFEDSSDEEVPDSIKYVVNGKHPNVHKAVNGHIPLSSASTSSATTSMKAKLIESDDELLE